MVSLDLGTVQRTVDHFWAMSRNLELTPEQREAYFIMAQKLGSIL